MIYFTADLHFDHRNIIKYCDRPWDTVEEMNHGLIENWNNTVSPKDEVYILGDFCFHKKSAVDFADKLNGKKYLIIGNHDRHMIKTYKDAGCFEWVRDYYELKIDKLKIILFHYALRVWNKSHHGSWLLFAHSHGTLDGLGKSFDVGCDSWDWKPVSLEQVKKEMDKRKIYFPDHHEESTNE